MTLNRPAIESRIPHAGGMCLLDEVLSWDASHIRALSRSHRHPDNPLARQDGLHAVHLVEYAAQAAAVHGALMAEAAGDAAPAGGVLAGVRQLVLHAPVVDTGIEALEISATHLLTRGAACLYVAEVRGGGRLLLQGRLAVHLTA